MKKDMKAPHQAKGTELTSYNMNLLGNKCIGEPVFRKYACRICGGSFKRSEGILMISGFRCFADLPSTWPGSD